MVDWGPKRYSPRQPPLSFSPRRGENDRGGCRGLVVRFLPEPLSRRTSSFVPRRSTSSVILPSFRLTSSLPSRRSRTSCITLRESARAACFWPFLPEWQKRPLIIKARDAAFRRGAFSRALFLGFVFFYKLKK